VDEPGVILKMEGITKKFPGVLALDKVNFSMKKEEIHALVGENGAGKSTLIKILSGVHKPDEGKIFLDGEYVAFSNPIHAIEKGISVIYQELNLVEELSVAENIYLGKENRNWWNLGKKVLIERAEKLLSKLNFPISASEKVKNLNVSEKQLVEIAKAMATNAKVIVMDEPTATITEHEAKQLFSLMRGLKEQGVSIIFISHRLEEVFEIADSVTVLRDGKLISTGKIDQYDKNRLISDVVGRTISDMYPKENTVTDVNAFEVEELSVPGYVNRLSFNVKKGEILGIAGLVGCGKSEVALAIYGGIKAHAKKALLDGERVSLPTRPDVSLERGVLLIPEDRKSQGLVLLLSVTKNIILPNTKFITKLGHIRWKEGRKISGNLVKKLNIKTPTLSQKVENLSGGNQQKVVLAKGLVRKPKLIIFAEPTRGIDVGAKVEVYKLMNELANQGVGIIMISSELPEIVSMSDRVLVMHRGVQKAILEGENINQENIMAAAMGG